VTLRAGITIVVCSVLVLAAIVVHDRLIPKHPIILDPTSDYVAFYCAGEAVRTANNPYRVEPLRSCEHRITDDPNKPAWVVTPAPFPGYAMALFAGLSLFSYEVSHVLWTFASLLAAGVIVWSLARLTGYEELPLALIIAPGIGLENIIFGGPQPFVAAALALGAHMIRRRAWRIAGIIIAFTLLEPHVGLPIVAATLLFFPKARGGLLAMAAALALVSFIALGPAGNVEYFTRALPLHAYAELVFRSQYSLSHMLWLAKVPDATALAAGGVSYSAMAAFGIWAGRRLAQSYANDALAVLLPAAGAMVGGTYIHDSQIFSAVVVAVGIASIRAIPSALRTAPLYLLMVHWNSTATSRLEVLLIIAAVIAAGRITLHDAAGTLTNRLVAYVAMPVGVAMLFVALHAPPTSAPNASTVVAPPTVAATDSASVVWAYYVRHPITFDTGYEIRKIPTWLGLGVLFAPAFARRKQRVSP